MQTRKNKQTFKIYFETTRFRYNNWKGSFTDWFFLEIRLNLRDNIYETFRKENATIKYINNELNHPKPIIKAINPIINQRLSNLLSDIQVFNDRVKPYNEALKITT